jgi:hypothetical protein
MISLEMHWQLRAKGEPIIFEKYEEMGSEK